MKITILGCGSALGVPLIGDQWGGCINNKKNNRLRSSVIIEIDDVNILIDTGPDLRQQLLREKIRRIDAVLYTHAHPDHISGISELKSIWHTTGNSIESWGSSEANKELLKRYGYIFNHGKPPFGLDYKPFMNIHEIDNLFYIGTVPIISFQHNHGKCDCTTYRIKNFAYTTDVKKFYDGTLKILNGIDTWIVSCLSVKEHTNHASFDEVLSFIKQVNPKRAYLTHMSNWIDYNSIIEKCPENVQPLYDKMKIIV